MENRKARACVVLLLLLQCSWLLVRVLYSEREAPDQDATGRALQLQLPTKLRDGSRERDGTSACREVSDEEVLREHGG